MNIPNLISDSEGIKIPPNVQYAIGVDGINTKILPVGSTPRVVYRIGDGTIHQYGWENIEGNKYLDFYISGSSFADIEGIEDLITHLTDFEDYNLASQQKAWEAEAQAKTALSYAIEPEDTFVKTYTSNNDGTFTATDTTDYSALHYASKYPTTTGGQFTGGGLTKPLMYTSKVVTENTTIPTGVNALAIDELIIEDGVTLTLEEDVIMKVV